MMPFGMEVGLVPSNFVLDGKPAPLPKRRRSPLHNFRPMSIVAKPLDVRIPLGAEVGLSLGDIVLDGDTAPPSLKGNSPHFRPMTVVAKPLDGLRCHLVWPRPRRLCVWWRRSSPTEKKWNITHPIFGQCLLWPNGWMDEYATLYGSRPRPRPHYVRRGPSSPAKGAQQPRPSFRPMSIVATVAHLSYCWALVCLCTKYLGNRWTDLCQIHREDVFGPSLGRV